MRKITIVLFVLIACNAIAHAADQEIEGKLVTKKCSEKEITINVKDKEYTYPLAKDVKIVNADGTTGDTKMLCSSKDPIIIIRIAKDGDKSVVTEIRVQKD